MATIKKPLIKRADDSSSQHGLWDSLRENKGSGKKPTSQMIKQEKKIKKAKNGTSVPDGPLIKKKGAFKGSTLKNGGNISCWKGYKKEGSKMKSGKKVNNCIKK